MDSHLTSSYDLLELAFYKLLVKNDTKFALMANKTGEVLFATPQMAVILDVDPSDTNFCQQIKQSWIDMALSLPISGSDNIHLKISSKRYSLHHIELGEPIQKPHQFIYLQESQSLIDSIFEPSFQSLFSASINGMVVHDQDGVILDANPMASYLFGIDKKKLVGMDIKALTLAEQFGFFDNPHLPNNTGDAQSYEFSYSRPDGAQLELEASSRLLGSCCNNLYLTELTDISAVRQNEERIKMMLTALEQSPSSIVMTNLKGEIEFVNPKFCEITGYTPQEIIGQKPNVLKTVFTPPETYKLLWEKISNGEVWQGEFVNKKKNGDIYYEEAIISPIANKEGKIKHYLAIKHDVSRLKQQTAELQNYLAILNALLESTDDRIWSLDKDYKIITTNSHYQLDFLNDFGVLLQKGDDNFDCVPQSTRDEWISRYNRVFQGESFTIEDFVDYPGNHKWISTKFSPITLAGKIIGSAQFSRNITQQKLAEATEKANAARLKSLIDNTTDMIWSVDRDLNILVFNTNVERLFSDNFGVRINIGMPITEKLPPDVRQRWDERYKKSLSGISFSETDTIETDTGTQYIDTSFNPIEIDGVIEGVSCFARNITSQKRYEQSLRESRAQLNSIFNTLESGILLVDSTTKHISIANGYMARLLGYKLDDLIGKSQAIIKFRNGLTENETIGNRPDWLVTPFNTEIPVMRSQARISIQDKPYDLYSLIDISAQKEQERLIRQLSTSALKLISFDTNEQIFRFLIDQLENYLPNSIIALNTYNADSSSFELKTIEGMPTSLINKMVDQSGPVPLGLSAKLPKPYIDILKKAELIELEQGLTNLLSNELPAEQIYKLQKILSVNKVYLIGIIYQDKLFGALTIITRFRKEVDSPNYIETLIFQASVALQRKHLEMELIEAKHEAEKANKAKSAFVANMGHEIRTPMNAVIGFADILYKETEDPIAKNYLNSILSSGKTMLSIINDLLDLSKIEAGEMTLRRGPTNLHGIADEMHHVFLLKAQENGIDLVTKTENCIQGLLLLDDLRIRQILLNLLGNALKFTHKGSVELSIATHESTRNQVDLTLTVTDTGIGIKPEMQQSIFLAFRQQDEQDSRKYGGTGLGLAITQKLVGLMGGYIELESSPNEGSRFSVHIPSVEIVGNMAIQNRTHNVDKPNETPLVKIDFENALAPHLVEKLKTELEQKFVPLWKSFAGKQSMPEIEQFAQELIILGEQTQFGLILEYGKRLLAEVTSFDIVEMRRTLKDFEQINAQILAK